MYVGKVAEGGNGCFTTESRPHNDWLGAGWWRDLDICLDAGEEAQSPAVDLRREMVAEPGGRPGKCRRATRPSAWRQRPSKWKGRARLKPRATAASGMSRRSQGG